MKKVELLRVYNKNDKYANTGECYFLILPDKKYLSEKYDAGEWLSYKEAMDLEIEKRIARISGMGWQDYTSYMLGHAEINEDSETSWSEISNYELKECCIDIERVTITGKYKIPFFI